MLKPRSFLIGLLLLSLCSIFIALKYGTISISFANLFYYLWYHQNFYHQIIINLRLPRVGTAFTAGGLLGLAGVLLQVLLRNPLADPYILGVSGGAAVVTLLLMSLGMSVIWQSTGAVVGALLTMLFVFMIARGLGAWSPTRLLLTGVIIASGCSAMISLILVLSPDRIVHSMLFWLLGDIGYGRFPWAALVVLLTGLFIGMLWSRQLNIFSHGEKQALSLGVNYQRLSFKLYFLSAVLTAVTVSFVGTIGFIGLLVPHMVRALVSNNHYYLIPGSVLLGGSLLTIADTVARSVIAPEELPVGIITALLGVPLFLYILLRGYQK